MASNRTSLNFPRDKISLCMIVKNEERALHRCLDSVRDWVGEVVVIDTGSTDATVEIALSYGARVGHFAWCDDFSAARNAALDLATREWVLVLDGDEALHVEDPQGFARALLQTQWDGFSLPIRSLNDDGAYSKAMVFRLFRRAKAGMRYRGEVHEQLDVVASGKLSTSVLSCVFLDHDGYTAAVVASADKVNRNVRLSRKLTLSRPDDPFSWFVYSMALNQIDQDAMLEAAHRAIALVDADRGRAGEEHYVVNLYVAVINTYQSRGDWGQALLLADKALIFFPDSPDLNYLRGTVRVSMGDFSGAAGDYLNALSPRACAFGLHLDPAAVGYGARTALAHALRRAGRFDEAIAELQTAIRQIPPEYANAHAEMGFLLVERGAISDAVPFLEEAYRRTPNAAGVAFQLSSALYLLGKVGRAEEILRRQIADPTRDFLLARILLETGKADQAIELLTDHRQPAALLTLGWANFVLGFTEQSASAWNAWLSQVADENELKGLLVLFRALIAEVLDGPEAVFHGAVVPREVDAWVLLLFRYQLTVCIDRLFDRIGLAMGALWPDIRIRWAQSLVLSGFVEAGLSLLLSAARENPGDGAVYYWLGYCAVLREQVEDARAMFEECLRLDAQHQQARQALSLLQNANPGR